jgi:hypothetical protein
MQDWGLAFILAFVIGGALYVVGGVGWAVKAKGAAPGLAALPHREFWGELGALVLDGVSYSKARASGGGGGALTEKIVPEAAGPAAPAAEESDDDSDGLVE